MDPCSDFGYSNYTKYGIGCDRSRTGSAYTSQYPSAWTRLLDDPSSTPEELLLFFHNVPWSFRLKSGLTIQEHIDASANAGIQRAAEFQAFWSNLTDIDPDLQHLIGDKFSLQISDAKFFKKTLLGYWHKCEADGKYNGAGACEY